MSNGQRGRIGVRGLMVMVAVAAAAVLAPASAEALSNSADAGTWQAHGRVLAMAHYGNILYIGGRFDRIQSAKSDIKIPADNLAAIDLTTGEPVPGFAASVTMTAHKPQVDALAVSADGTRLFVGGKFSTVDGQPQSFFATLSAATGALDPTFTEPDPSGAVHTILVGPDRIYLGGSFKKIDRQTRSYLAALLPDGGLDPTWTPSANDLVRNLTAAPDWQTIFIGGLFTQVDGADRGSVARVAADTGAIDNWAIPAGTIDPPQTAWDMVIYGSTLYVGFGHGPNYLAAFRLDDGDVGDQIWRLKTQGNVEGVAMAPDGSRLFFSGHFGTGQLQQRVCGGVFLRGLASVDPATGTILCDWLPQITPYGENFVGVWTLEMTDANTLYIGGKITTVGGKPHRGYAKFSLDAAP